MSALGQHKLVPPCRGGGAVGTRPLPAVSPHSVKRHVPTRSRSSGSDSSDRNGTSELLVLAVGISASVQLVLQPAPALAETGTAVQQR